MSNTGLISWVETTLVPLFLVFLVAYIKFAELPLIKKFVAFPLRQRLEVLS